MDICDFNMTLPYAQNLWEVNYEAELLDYLKADLFHSLTSKLLYITKRKRSEIEPAVALFTTRVAKINWMIGRNLKTMNIIPESNV